MDTKKIIKDLEKVLTKIDKGASHDADIAHARVMAAIERLKMHTKK